MVDVSNEKDKGKDKVSPSGASNSDPEVVSSSGKIVKFDGTNYQWWRIQIEDELYERKLHLPLVDERPDDMTEKEWALLDRRALAVVRKALTQAVAFNVGKETTVKGLLDALQGVYEKSSASNRLFLIKRLVYLRMTEGKAIADHLNDFNKIWAQVDAVELSFDDDVKSLFFLSSLPDSWDTVVTTISNSTKEKLKFQDVISVILDQESMIKCKTPSMPSSNSALTTFERGREQERGGNRNRSKSRGQNNRNRSKSRGKGKTKVKCWVCEKEGHVKKDCPERAKNAANVVQGHEEKLCLSAHDTYSSDLWYIDSGASFHCTSHKEWFSDFIVGDFGHVVVGNGQMCKIEGRGIIKLQVQGEGRLILNEVRYIPI